MAMPVPTHAIDVMTWHWWHWWICFCLSDVLISWLYTVHRTYLLVGFMF